MNNKLYVNCFVIDISVFYSLCSPKVGDSNVWLVEVNWLSNLIGWHRWFYHLIGWKWLPPAPDWLNTATSDKQKTNTNKSIFGAWHVCSRCCSYRSADALPRTTIIREGEREREQAKLEWATTIRYDMKISWWHEIGQISKTSTSMKRGSAVEFDWSNKDFVHSTRNKIIFYDRYDNRSNN